MYKSAIILAAGVGTRLKPLTDQIPKPLVQVTDKTILQNALDHLEKIGIENVIIVTGYLKHSLHNNIGNFYKRMKITYINNEEYYNTNSMYSLLLGLNQVKNDSVLILEGDVFFEYSIIEKIPLNDIVWVGDSSIKSMDGCYLISKNNKVTEIKIFNKDEMKNDNEVVYSKSVGLLALKAKSVLIIIEMLQRGIEEKKEKLYYDLIIADNIKNLDITLHDIAGKKWFEIDSVEDLKTCQRIFSNDKNSFNNN
ncbi:MAG: phosphocholine cytidylyltransferase family protein [Bacteroidetes bacterium]|nr:phosphocholine cytidylyltransferase family protein [Bacteroidota bacterium]MBS1649283.1 phosphocholine cytidylyltransferase family protein [Bacteroidota bacterium]